jgi:predicted nucleotidyltransferase
LQAHQADLSRQGVRHAAVFGSLARGEAHPASDIDVLLDLDPALPMGLFEYARLKLHLAELLGPDLGRKVDVVNRKTLKPLLKDSILRDAVDAF